jgi:hypothetical protein
MWTPWKNRKGIAKILMIFVTLLLVASGLCGVQIYLLNHGSGSGNVLAPIFMLTGVIELVVIAVAAVGIVVVLIIWGLKALVVKSSDDVTQD